MGKWLGKIALGDGKAYVRERCFDFSEVTGHKRSQCLEMRLGLEEERRLSYFVTLHDLAQELVVEPK